jgi:predicted RNase H-like HicB family nuclease
MRQARYEIVEDDGSFHGEIPSIHGVWANAATLEACREELESVLEGWVLLSIADHSPIPEIDGDRIDLNEDGAEFKRLSQSSNGDSHGWKFDREEAHERR